MAWYVDKEMAKALEADGKKMRQLTGENHGPMSVADALAGIEENTRRKNSDLNDYEMYRGKCKQMSIELTLQDPSLTLVRGYYYCPFWGEQEHWWCKRTDGTIVDPTKNQFPSKGIGEYVEFDGIVHCSECGKEMKEDEADYESNYCFCSYECHGRFVGVW